MMPAQNTTTAPMAQHAAVPFTYTLFRSANAPRGDRIPATWAGLCSLLPGIAPTAPAKASLAMIKLATFRGDYRNDVNLETVYGIEGDYDGEHLQPEQAVEMLRTAGIEAMVYTSPSHRLDAPRWRVLAPLSQAVAPSARHALTARLNGALGGILAPESFTASQAYYIGAVEGGQPVQWSRVSGQPLDLLNIAPLLPVTGAGGGSGTRHPLGDPSLAAPSLEWIRFALARIDPNGLGRPQWVPILAAVKQAGWTLADDATLFGIASEWCARYENDDPAENAKEWRSFRETQVGWPYLVRQAPGLAAQLAFGGAGGAVVPVSSQEVLGPVDLSGEILTAEEQKEYFRGCVFVAATGCIHDATGAALKADRFRAKYGGKLFIWTSEGKLTDDAWKAATCSTQWTVPKVDRTRFLPDETPGAIVDDELGRRGVNTYRPAVIRRVQGDPSIFLDHLARMIPDEDDRRILLGWMAHVVKYPGFKIPWAPVIQSAEGVGKGIIKKVMSAAVGASYRHFPKASELKSSGGKFNGWMRNKLFILADEIKVDDKRDLIEVLKPLISETSIEIQSKGVDQEMADNYANWAFFTNYKDAIPASKNGRRYAIFFSPIQTEQDILAMGMDDAYFRDLYQWLDEDGAAIVVDWLLNYPIERGKIPMRAPKTTSWGEAVELGRGWLQELIVEAVADERKGFRGGWINTVALGALIRAERGCAVTPAKMGEALKAEGYHKIGRASRGWLHDGDPVKRGHLWSTDPAAHQDGYGRAQGYE